MICTGYIKSAWRTGAVWELLAERKHRTKSQCDWPPPPPRLYIAVAYIGKYRAFFLSVSPSRVDNRNFVRYPLAQTGGRCLIRKTSQFQRGSLFLSAWRLGDVLLISYTGSYNVLSAGLLFHSRPRSYFSWSWLVSGPTLPSA